MSFVNNYFDASLPKFFRQNIDFVVLFLICLLGLLSLYYAGRIRANNTGVRLRKKKVLKTV